MTPPKVEWIRGTGDDEGWYVGRLRGSPLRARVNYRIFQVLMGDVVLREGIVEQHQVTRRIARTGQTCTVESLARDIAEQELRHRTEALRRSTDA